MTPRLATMNTSDTLVPAGRPAFTVPGFVRAHGRLLLASALAAAVCGGLVFGLPHWPGAARTALGVFAFALIGWTVLRLDETQVALGAALALVVANAARVDSLYAGLGSELVWLLIGAFVLAAVLQQSGLAERWARAAVAGAPDVRALMMRLTWVIVATAFVIPSTSGRAALLLPLFLALARAVGDPRIVRALALLFPSVILLSAGASMLGAGAHLLALDLLRRLGLESPGFVGWIWLAAPFSIASCVVAAWTISRLFLDAGERRRGLHLPPPDGTPLAPAQRHVAMVVAGVIAAWSTTGLHGLDAATIALAGALLSTWAPLTGVSLKSALKKVEWNLLLFMAATLVMGDALLQSGAARLVADSVLGALPLQQLAPQAVVLVAVVLAMASHLVITSRTARALVLLPAVALPLAATGLNPAVLVLVTVLGSGFCQTLNASAKPVALFAQTEVPTYDSADLLRLSAALAVPVATLLLLAAVLLWPLQGLALHR